MAAGEARTGEREFLARTTATVQDVFTQVAASIGLAPDEPRLARLQASFTPGKMLRTRLAYALAEPEQLDGLVVPCAATEMVHNATLFHDDVIDGASLRRNQPTLWRTVGETGAILLGDLFFCCSVELLVCSPRPELARAFVGKVREVCATEACHELLFRDAHADTATALRLARGKTGALFAFTALACGGADARRTAALEEAGYRLGTAYQVADDLLDELGSEAAAGKTLGTDRKRGKFTLAQQAGLPLPEIRATLEGLLAGGHEQLTPWPALAGRYEDFGQRLFERLLAGTPELAAASPSPR